MDQITEWNYVSEKFTQAVRLQKRGEHQAARETARVVGWHGEIDQSLLDGWNSLKEFKRAGSFHDLEIELMAVELQDKYKTVLSKMNIPVPFPDAETKEAT